MSQYIDDYCNDIAREQYNFINDKPIKNNKMKVELIQKTTLTDMYYVIKVNGEFHMSYNDYDEAVRAYDKIKSATPREEVILSKEI